MPAKPALAVVGNGHDDLAALSANFRAERDWTVADLARESKISVYAIRAIEKGKKASRKNTRALREYLAAHVDEVSELAPVPGHLDGTAKKLKETVVNLARENDRGLGLLKYVADKLSEEEEAEYLGIITDHMLNKLLLSTEDEDARLKRILDLYDVVKNCKTE